MQNQLLQGNVNFQPQQQGAALALSQAKTGAEQGRAGAEKARAGKQEEMQGLKTQEQTAAIGGQNSSLKRPASYGANDNGNHSAGAGT